MPKTFCALSLLIVGTGSSYNLNAAGQWHSFLEHRSAITIESTFSPELRIDVRTPTEYLENIRKILNPAIVDLADLFDVSRQAVYKWLAQDSFPESEKLDCIKALSDIADTFKNAHIQRAGILLKIKNDQGVSLFDMLKAKKPYEEQVKMLINEAKIVEDSYQQSGLAQSRAKPTNDWMSSISIPTPHEDA